MLDTATKRRIDTARDILVGKVPDPKSQVEQITIALIYKFMDDMDADSEAMGGERKFFASDFARYGWSKLMRSGLSGHETLNLYAEAIGRMPENPGMPTLFRDIFKNAYLPYRDPETLRAFLKIIDEFEYDHSERLGDAFEYLLSVLGSQGDAGQFRTPRHIIDFIVKIVDPQKSDRVLDPACGTAGFLISAWKHILASNTDDKGNSTLQPEEKAKLAANFQGYDISPDMVRLSLANMYLHGFTDPHIVEYDTLTSDDRWNEHFDVILANPPFMTPTGGIHPHNRFSVQCKKSEVLFVAYIAEHLTPNGRAAVIVPDGVISTAQSAYQKLRKELIANSLVAVISLPTGVFQPYSGVKTSILILDKALNRQVEDILMIEINTEGTDLGARRKVTQASDLPTALAIFLDWKSGNTGAWAKRLAVSVPKQEIELDRNYTLSGIRYRVSVLPSQNIHPTSPLAGLLKQESAKAGALVLPVWSVSNSQGFVPSAEFFSKQVASDTTANYKIVDSGSFAYNPSRINVGSVAYNDSEEIGAVSPMYVVFSVVDASLDPRFLLKILKSAQLRREISRVSSGSVRAQLRFKDLEDFEIPLPPIEMQREIVAEIEGYQKVIDGARMVVENYRPHIAIDPSWPLFPLGELVEFLSGGTPSKAVPEYWDGDIPWISAKDLKKELLNDAIDHISAAAVGSSATKIAPRGALLVLIRGMGLANGIPVCELTAECAFNQDIKALIPGEKVNSTYLRVMIRQHENELRSQIETAAHGTLKLDTETLKALNIPVPTLDLQNSIVSELAAEQELIDANHELIARFEERIQATLARVWGDDAPVAGVAAEPELVAAE